VSKAISSLEADLGLRLFDRGPQGVEPTAYGRVLLDAGVAVFDELRQRAKQLEHLADPSAGDCRIGTVEFLAGGLVSTAIDQLTAVGSRSVFHITVADGSSSLLRELRERKVDVAIGRVPTEFDDTEFEADKILDEYLYVVGGATSPWASKRKIKLADLIDEPWTLPPLDSLAGEQIADIFRAHGLDLPRARATSFSIQLHCNLVATGRTLGVMPGSFLHYSKLRNSIKILPVEMRSRPRPVAVLTVRNRTISPLARAFTEQARACGKVLAKAKSM
jgi:DNA-binding transcriptional LysR family regulator